MAVTDEMQKIALELLPNSCCLVPEKRQEVTTEGGLDVFSQQEKVKNFVTPLQNAGIKVSLFIDPDEKQVKAAAYTNAQFIELHTGSYSRAFNTENEEIEFQKLKNATKLAQDLGLKVNAGHGLNYKNVHRMHEIDGLYELNIGHSIISRAVFVGLDTAVKDMLNLVNKN
jgi:pyridoxine 5-phosphate synthase